VSFPTHAGPPATAAHRTPEHRWLVLLAVLAPLALLALGLGLEPDPRGHGTHEQLGLPACTVRDWLGTPCPGCGVTTAAVLLLHGHPLRSWTTQPLGLVGTLSVLVLSAAVLALHLRGRDAWVALVGRADARWAKAAAAVVLLAWMWRVAWERWA
jgi:hypothetical protein